VLLFREIGHHLAEGARIPFLESHGVDYPAQIIGQVVKQDQILLDEGSAVFFATQRYGGDLLAAVWTGMSRAKPSGPVVPKSGSVAIRRRPAPLRESLTTAGHASSPGR